MEIRIPKLFYRALIRPSSFDKEHRTVDVVFSTGAEVERGFWESYFETLSLDPTHVRLDRLRSGAPVLDAHMGFALRNVIGVVESAEVDGKEGRARIRFSDRAEVGPILRDIENGILRNISVGYIVHKYEDRSDKDENGKLVRRMHAVDWEPVEISVVPIPADAGAQMRSEDQELYKVFVERKNMADEIKKATQEATATLPSVENREKPLLTPSPVVDEEKIRREAVETERKRIAEIKIAVRKASLQSDFADQLVSEGVTVDRARSLILDAMEKRSQDFRPISTTSVEIMQDGTVTRRQAVENALLSRFDSKQYKISEAGREYRYFSLIEIARQVVEWRGLETKTFSKMEIAHRAFHSTSDFVEILANVANKTLRDGYTAQPQTFTPFVRRNPVPDFKQISRPQLGEAPQLEEVAEDGEIKYGTIKEGAEKYSLASHGKIVGLSRKAIINDDLGAFTRIPRLFGAQAARLESKLVWAIITGNKTMADGKAIFHADHSNLAGSGAVISVTSLGVARKSIRLQKGLDGVTEIDIPATHLVVPAALETVAEQFLAVNVRQTATKADDVNPFSGRMELVSESRLDAASATAWYMFSNAAMIDMIELAVLEGQDGPVIETHECFEVDGIKFKCTYDVAAKALDYRGFYKNPGA